MVIDVRGLPKGRVQLEFPIYILEARTPTLAELCTQVPTVTTKPKRRKPRKNLPRQYPSNWQSRFAIRRSFRTADCLRQSISTEFREGVDYICEYCGVQCLKPGDNKSNLSISEIGRLTMQCHHVDGDRWNNQKNNVRCICAPCHLRTHRGRANPLKGQGKLFLFTLDQ